MISDSVVKKFDWKIKTKLLKFYNVLVDTISSDTIKILFLRIM